MLNEKRKTDWGPAGITKKIRVKVSKILDIKVPDVVMWLIYALLIVMALFIVFWVLSASRWHM